jgi:phosphatidate cytidylyltransferase
MPVDANLRSRLATAAVGIPLLVWIIGWGPSWLFSGLFLFLTAGALHEYFAMTFPDAWRKQLAGVAFGIGLALIVVFYGEAKVIPALGVFLVLLFSLSLFFRVNAAARLGWLARMLLGGFYIGYLVPFIVLLFDRADGRAWVCWLLFVIMAGDSSGYFIGRRFGKKKLAPAISPGKTVQGAWGYLAGAIIIGLSGAALLFRQMGWLEVLFLSLTVGVLGQLGDLFESSVKRAFAVKDSGAMLPGHGGLLDRLDSLIFPAVVTTTYLRIFQS